MWHEARFEVKTLKTPHSRSVFGIVEKVHATVAQSRLQIKMLKFSEKIGSWVLKKRARLCETYFEVKTPNTHRLQTTLAQYLIYPLLSRAMGSLRKKAGIMIRRREGCYRICGPPGLESDDAFLDATRLPDAALPSDAIILTTTCYLAPPSPS